MDIPEGFEGMDIGKGRMLREGDSVAVLSFGPIGNYTSEAAERLAEEGIEIGHYDMRFAKPLDTELLDEIADKYRHVITLEDGCKMGGFGSAVAEYYIEKEIHPTLNIMAVPDRIVEHGSQRQLHDEVGIGPDGIVEAVRKALVQI